MDLDFSGQVALVTGASRGIGERIARDLAQRGAELIVTSTRQRQDSPLEERFGVPTRHCVVDFSDRESTDAFLTELRGVDRLDVCVNNAGIARHGPMADATPEDWDATVDVNLRAPFMVTQAAAVVMKRSGYGRIVNIASIWGHISRQDRSVYTGTKFGLRGVSVSAAVELAEFGILVNTVSPGFILTDMARENYSEAEREKLVSRIPVGRLGVPEDISNAVLFLASKMNTFITGQSLVVDGGYSVI